MEQAKMAMMIVKLLQHLDMFPKTRCKELCLTVINAGENSYAALYNLLWNVHPLLTENEVQTTILHQA